MRTACHMRWCQQQQPGAAIWVDKRSYRHGKPSLWARDASQDNGEPTKRSLHRKTKFPSFTSMETSSATCLFLLLLIILLLLLLVFIVLSFQSSPFSYSLFSKPPDRPSWIYNACATYMYTSSSSWWRSLQHIFQYSLVLRPFNMATPS
jgi:hypothetical protein